MYQIRILLIFVNIYLIKTQYKGEECTTSKGVQGLCTTVGSCPETVDEIKKNIFPETCGFENQDPIICCTKSQRITTPGVISKQKCQEYAKSVVRPQGIVGGVRSPAKEFPHMVALGYDDGDDRRWLCGGSLLSEKFVLTAAHCLRTRDFGEVKWALLGTVNLNQPSEGGNYQESRINKIIPHPNYKPPLRYNDIGLVQFESTVQFSQYVIPACLNANFNFKPGTVTATGWGRLKFGETASNNLMKVELEIHPYETCSKKYLNISKLTLPNGIDEESHLCAGGSVNESKDTCEGDSGGPLQISQKDNFFHYDIIGITSFGRGCGTVNSSGVYTRVSNYVIWIESVVWP